MLKKSLLCLTILTLFYCDLIYAYEFIDSNNASVVNEKIKEIYDVKQQYEDLAGSYNVDSEETIINEATNDHYWWPIGSINTEESNGKTFATGDPETVNITSPYAKRLDPFGSGVVKFHAGLDISGGRGLGNVNVIAAKDGTVVYSSAKNEEQCPSGKGQSNCGGGYGNYIIIQHTDGNYTLYGHLYESSITVSEGESVTQGQVIAKMGSSGNSTGAHLHFEIREGQNSRNSAVDPLNYVSTSDTRPANASDKLVKYIEKWEGHTQIIGDSYKVVNIGDGVRTVGAGVTLESNASKFKARGIDVSNYGVGSTIPISIVDSIEAEIISEKKSYIESKLAKNGITLKENQIDALVSFMYNIGNIDRFPAAYKKYGDTEALYDNFFSKYVHSNGKVWQGLVRRRKDEWNLFHNGIYGVD